MPRLPGVPIAHHRICHTCGESKPQLGFDQKTNQCLECRPDAEAWAQAKLNRIDRDRRQLADVMPAGLAKRLNPRGF